MLDAYDQEEMVEPMRYRDQPLEAVLARFLSLRQERLAMLAGLDEAVWDRVGHHETYGALTWRQITTHMCNHDINHMAQISRMLQG